MQTIMNRPGIVFVFSLVLLRLATQLGTYFHKNRPDLMPDERDDFNVVLTATLTLLGLVIGFSFSMAVGRYDQRKNYEEAEANAIGTEYLRADLLPEADGARVRELLRQYLDLRIEHYGARGGDDLRRIDADTARVQGELWTAASGNVK